MKLVIETSYRENYGAHDWNGEGVCPQYWKNKGGDEFIVDEPFTSTSPEAIAVMVDALRPTIEQADDYSETRITGWVVVANDFLTQDEQDQLEWDGHIAHPSPRINLKGVRVNPTYIPNPIGYKE